MGRGKPFKTSIDRLVNAGVIPRPIWLDVVNATRPPFEPVTVTKSRPIRYPEDRLRATYLRRNPDARRIPVDLKASTVADRHVSDRFVAIQMRLMREDRLSERDAYKATEDILQRHEDDAHAMMAEEMAGPLSDSSIADETARLYMASVKDSQRDRKLFDALQSSTISEDATSEAK